MELARVKYPPVLGEVVHDESLQAAPAQGLRALPDGKTLWSTRKIYSNAYIYSLLDFEEIDRMFVGQHSEWVTESHQQPFVKSILGRQLWWASQCVLLILTLAAFLALYSLPR